MRRRRHGCRAGRATRWRGPPSRGRAGGPADGNAAALELGGHPPAGLAGGADDERRRGGEGGGGCRHAPHETAARGDGPWLSCADACASVYSCAMASVAGLLDGPRARGAFLLRTVLDPPWSMRIEDEAPLTLVAMVRGAACV